MAKLGFLCDRSGDDAGPAAKRTAPDASRPPLAGRRVLRSRLWLLLPIGIVYGALAVVPLVLIVRFSLVGGLTQYREVLSSPLLAHIVENTVVISITTTVIAVLLGYLLAAALWRSGPRMRVLLLILVLLPFWTGVLVKNFAWAALLQDNGAINELLRIIGPSHEALPLLHNRLAVIIGMVHYVLPYAVFPIYTVMLSIDDRLERAAKSLGASAFSVAWLVIMPLTLPGVYAAGLLVFIISTGFFITPVILGGPSDMMVANLVDFYAHQLVDFNRAAALAVLIVMVISVLVFAYQRTPKEGQYGAV
ncbi:MAG TPA: ABC transporter permease [Alphaproteobacteria bacterium]|nr:ABC transporter permease [Alphaproteobacteria bacterium]